MERFTNPTFQGEIGVKYRVTFPTANGRGESHWFPRRDWAFQYRAGMVEASGKPARVEFQDPDTLEWWPCGDDTRPDDSKASCCNLGCCGTKPEDNEP